MTQRCIRLPTYTELNPQEIDMWKDNITILRKLKICFSIVNYICAWRFMYKFRREPNSLRTL